MIYQVRTNLYFTDHDEARDFVRDSELALLKSHTLNPDSPDEEKGTIELIENHHDESPNASCSIIEQHST